MLLLTLRGTPTLYYGDEIGMRDVDIPSSLVRDPFERNVPGCGLGRDPERSPMQWSAAAQAGFTQAEPWLPIAPDYREVNVEAQGGDERSMLALYRRLIALRRSGAALETGSFALVDAPAEVLAYVRGSPNRESEFFIALNFGTQHRRVPLPDREGNRIVALSTHLDRDGERIEGTLELRGDEGVIVRRIHG
jgi:alpha-glucosidase